MHYHTRGLEIISTYVTISNVGENKTPIIKGLGMKTLSKMLLIASIALVSLSMCAMESATYVDKAVLFFDALNNEDAEGAMRLIDQGVDVSARDPEGYTFL